MQHTELKKPDGHVDEGSSVEGNSCGALVKINVKDSPQGEYMYFTVVNQGDSSAIVTVKCTWNYGSEEHEDRRTVTVAANTERSVFNFPKQQNPGCEIVGCRN